MIKLKWKVAPEETGLYRSFYKRNWPMAFFKNEAENVAGCIVCEDSYVPRKVREGKHAKLEVMVAVYPGTGKGFKWYRTIDQFDTIKEAKQFLQNRVNSETWKEKLPADMRGD